MLALIYKHHGSVMGNYGILVRQNPILHPPSIASGYVKIAMEAMSQL